MIVTDYFFTYLYYGDHLYFAFMPLGLLVVVDTHEQEVASVLSHFGGVLLSLDLFNGTVGILVVFQFEDDGGRINVLARDEHEVGKPLAGCKFSMDDVVVSCVIVSDGEHAGVWSV